MQFRTEDLILAGGAALINSSGVEYDCHRVVRPLPELLLARGIIKPARCCDVGWLGGGHRGRSPNGYSHGATVAWYVVESMAVTDVESQAKV